MKKMFSILVGVALAAFAAYSYASGTDPAVGVALAMGATAMPADVAVAFAQVFSPKVQFPRWYQPNPTIGAILVHSQEEEEGLKDRDWSPRPLPGSENLPARVNSIESVSQALAVLQAERDLFEAQKAAFLAQIDARIAGIGGPGPDTAGVPPSASATSAATQVAGALSDASPMAAPAPSKK